MTGAVPACNGESQDNYFWPPGHTLSDIITAATPAFWALVQQEKGIFSGCTAGARALRSSLGLQGHPNTHANTHTHSGSIRTLSGAVGSKSSQAEFKKHKSKEADSE